MGNQGTLIARIALFGVHSPAANTNFNVRLLRVLAVAVIFVCSSLICLLCSVALPYCIVF